ncbi:YhgE/Pip domain-containing protein [Collinsella bouchesdurhonensis]|uniref:YhgE/Pip domain-containing protein n=1 Tax=Collinsella bouchesdurhonensis TaxID=1907654 RepID=UPI0009E1AA9C|nr:YhgE/Pip domain-containing protein [Collinsella bouchesdurhonensis]
MKKALAIFKRDIKRLLCNPVALVITIGVCIIPSLYAWYNIVANWDPYGNTQNIKIAVANNDKGTTNDLVGELNAGDEVIDRLKDNDQLGWTIVDSEEEAKEGVESGEYYAALVIPSDFSEGMLSMLSGEFHQPKLTYYVNEKKSAVAVKVTDTGANTVEEQVNETFVSTVSQTVVEIAQKAGIDLEAGAQGAQDNLVLTIQNASGSVQKVRDALDGMNGTIDTTKDAIASADAALEGLNGQMPSLNSALDQGNQLLTSTRESATKLHTSLSSALTQGSTGLAQASSKANAAVGKLSGTVIAAQTKVDLALSDVQGLVDKNNAAIEALRRTLPDDAEFNNATARIIASLQQQNDNLASVVSGLQAQSDAIKTDANNLATASDSINASVQDGVTALGKMQEDLNTNVIPQLNSGLDSFSDCAGDLKGVLASLSPTISQVRSSLSQLSALLDQAKSTLADTSDQLATIQQKLDVAANDVAALRSSEAAGKLADLLDVNVDDIADFMTSPVKIKSKVVYPVASFGSGIAPFYTNLALWVGGYVLIAIFKLEVDREGIGAYTAKEGYFGRWLLMMLLGIMQAIIVCVGDLIIGVQCLHPVLFVLAGMCISFVYVNIIYALSVAFKHIGKAIGVILVIVQIPGSSGMYPIEMMPPFFNWLHPLLPFTYGINAMRECVGGMYGMNYIINLGVLLIFVAIALGIGVWLRPLLLNLNLLFDRQLAATGVMICEKDDLPRQRYSLRTAMRAILDTAGFRQALIERAARFARTYGSRVKAGFFAIFGVQLLLFILTSTLDLDNNGRIWMLVLWIVSVIVIAAYLINLEYVRESLNTQMRVSALSDESLRNEIREHTSAMPGVAKMFGVAPQPAAKFAKKPADVVDDADEDTAANSAPLGAHAEPGAVQDLDVTAPLLGAHLKQDDSNTKGGDAE